MSEVLVLVDHVDGDVRRTTGELMTAARRLGEPSAVFVGTGLESARQELARFGAAIIYHVEDSAVTQHLVAPTAEVLAHLVREVSPAAVLIPSTPEGKEVAGRLSIKTGSGMITDAVDVQPGGDGVQTMQSVFAAAYTVSATVTRGTPIVTIKPNSVTAQEAPTSTTDRAVTVQLSEQATTATIVDRQEKVASGRPQLTEAAIVVSGGRGTGGDFSPVEAFADVMGAAVGLPCRGRRRLVSARPSGRADRGAGLTAALRRRRDLRCDPAPCGYADLQDDRGRQL